MEKITNAFFKHITMNNVISGCYYSDSGWVNMDKSQKEFYFNKMKQWLVAQTRKGSNLREELENTQLYYIHSCGILDRLWVDLRDEKVQYCAGQDYRLEMNIVKRVVAGRRI